jgi:hypothetical protein
MKVVLAKLYSRQREDGAIVLAGRFGWSGSGMLRILPADDYDPNDPKSAPFVAILEEAPPKAPQPYRGPQLHVPGSPRALGEGAIEGEVVDH